jgi:hypothetical protein
VSTYVYNCRPRAAYEIPSDQLIKTYLHEAALGTLYKNSKKTMSRWCNCKLFTLGQTAFWNQLYIWSCLPVCLTVCSKFLSQIVFQIFVPYFQMRLCNSCSIWACFSPNRQLILYDYTQVMRMNTAQVMRSIKGRAYTLFVRTLFL